jgi:hypothetical protein
LRDVRHSHLADEAGDAGRRADYRAGFEPAFGEVLAELRLAGRAVIARRVDTPGGAREHGIHGHAVAFLEAGDSRAFLDYFATDLVPQHEGV